MKARNKKITMRQKRRRIRKRKRKTTTETRKMKRKSQKNITKQNGQEIGKPKDERRKSTSYKQRKIHEIGVPWECKSKTINHMQTES